MARITSTQSQVVMVVAVCLISLRYKGRFIGIECKAGTNKPTALQQKNLTDIKLADGIALVVNEENIEEVCRTLENI